MKTKSALALLESHMVKIPGGEIALRDDRKKTQWTAQIQPFLLGQYQVTQALYFEVTGQRPASFKGDQRPVEEVSWLEAMQFCNLVSEKVNLQPCYVFEEQSKEVIFDEQANGYRLPTDAEWEYACRAGTRQVQYGQLEDIAWYKENSGETTHPVGLKMSNPWGLYDMLGNVWEWCWDVYDPEVYGSYRVLRGGGWFDPARGCLASNRRRSHPTYAIDDLGFRVARLVEI